MGVLKLTVLQTDTELVYKFSPLLMQYIPRETVSLWISLRGSLEPIKLIPALVQYDHNKNREQVSSPVCWSRILGRSEFSVYRYLISILESRSKFSSNLEGRSKFNSVLERRLRFSSTCILKKVKAK